MKLVVELIENFGCTNQENIGCMWAVGEEMEVILGKNLSRYESV